MGIHVRIGVFGNAERLCLCNSKQCTCFPTDKNAIRINLFYLHYVVDLRDNKHEWYALNLIQISKKKVNDGPIWLGFLHIM